MACIGHSCVKLELSETVLRQRRKIVEQETEIERLRDALRECDEALFHIRATYGGRYGVAWDRAIDKARAAISGKGE